MTQHSLIKSFLWSAVERFTPQIIQFGISIILARILLPAEYGLMAMLVIFFALAVVFADAGLSSGLIQRKEISNDEETSVFILNITAGMLLTLLLCVLSPLVAIFFRQPLLTMLLCVSSLQIFISSFGIVQYALLTRNLDFKKQAIISIVTSLISGTVGILMAWKGFGVWSLVGLSLTNSIINVALVWILYSWRPKGRFHWSCIRSLWPFSSRLLASQLLNTVFTNLYSIVIGRLYKPADLGYFTRASSISQLPANAIGGIVGRVTFPVFSSMQDNAFNLKANFRKTLRAVAALHFPAMIWLAAVSEPLVKCLLTDKWLPCVSYLQILCFSALLHPLHAMHLNILMALGRSDLFFKLEVVKKILTVIILAVTFSYGVMAMVWGILTFSILCYGINGYYSYKLLEYAWINQVKDLLPFFAAGTVTGLAAWFISRFYFSNEWLLIVMQCILGIAAYGLIVFVWRKTIYADAINIAKAFPKAVMNSGE